MTAQEVFFFFDSLLIDPSMNSLNGPCRKMLQSIGAENEKGGAEEERMLWQIIHNLWPFLFFSDESSTASRP